MQHRPISRASQKVEALAVSLGCECADAGSAGPVIEARHRRVFDRDFAALLALMLPRIKRLIVQYRMLDIADDAQQAAAIGVYRALQTYDPAKASFVTHATWQMRGELQSLRHRVRLDQRRSAVSAGISTVSLDGLTTAAGTSDRAILCIRAAGRRRAVTGGTRSQRSYGAGGAGPDARSPWRARA